MSIQVPDSPDALIEAWPWSRVPPPRAPEDFIAVPIRLCLYDRLAEVAEQRAAERPVNESLKEMIEVALWRYLEHLEDGGE